jgi:hypothetical protein
MYAPLPDNVRLALGARVKDKRSTGRKIVEGCEECDDNDILRKFAEDIRDKVDWAGAEPTGDRMLRAAALMLDLRVTDLVMSRAFIQDVLPDASPNVIENAIRFGDDDRGKRSVDHLLPAEPGIPPEWQEGIASKIQENEAGRTRQDFTETMRKLSLADWATRVIPPTDWLLGGVVSTTSKTLGYSPTGLGKTNLYLAIAIHLAAGKDFLHWRVPRPARVLYVDGEMPNTLAQGRIIDAIRRLGGDPGRLHYLNRNADFPDMPPLNRREEQEMPGVVYIESISNRRKCR